MSLLSLSQSMNDAWIEVFKVGVHTDSSGNTSDWTAGKIDSYLAKYDPEKHEAPVRVDHVNPGARDNGGPAFGWVETVKREGDTVFVKLKQVSKQFEEWVRQGLVKKRSIAFSDKFGIHHLAFLGYNCPAVPGMANVYSSAVSCLTIESEFSDSQEKTESDPVVVARILAHQAQKFQEAEAAKGRHITITEAVSACAGAKRFSEISTSASSESKEDYNLNEVQALARRAQEFQDREAAAGRAISMTEAVFCVKNLA